MTWISLCVVTSIIGYLLGYLSGMKAEAVWLCDPDKCHIEMQLEDLRKSPEPDPLRDERLDGFQYFNLLTHQRGTYVLHFALKLDDLAASERQVIGHTLNVYADGSAALELRFNVDEDDEVPF